MKDKYIGHILRLIQSYYNSKPTSIKHIGGGFYGVVYMVNINVSPYKLIVKIYTKEGMNQQEHDQLTILRKYASLPMPMVYFVHNSTEDVPIDVLVMEYIEGINASELCNLSDVMKKNIADQIIDNLIAYHNIINPKGFGEINSIFYERDWNLYYKIKVDGIYHKIKIMYKNENISGYVYSIAHKAYMKYHNIFNEKVEHARLIHGDYNTWNILVDCKEAFVTAVIDPCNCQWADPELDLYQLNNANGIYLGLLDNYKSKVKLSVNFEKKSRFYELFTELNHYYDANVTVNSELITKQAKQLEQVMN